MVYIEGNSGANYIDIEKIDDNRIRLKVGDCCVHTIDVIITAEVFSNFLTQMVLQSNTNLIEVAKGVLSWDKETNEKYLKRCESEWENK